MNNKSFILLLLVLLSTFIQPATAQDRDTLRRIDQTNADVVTRDRGNSFTRFRPSAVRTRWMLMDLGISGLHTKDFYTLDNGLEPFELRTFKSSNFNIHIWQQKLSISRGILNLKYGATVEWQKYYFDNPVILVEDAPVVEFEIDDENRYKKYRLTNSYLVFPVMLDFSSRPLRTYRSFHAAVGVYGGLLLGANFKTKGGGDKTKVRDNFNLTKWKAGLRGEIGYGPVILYGTWSLTELFEEKKNAGFEVIPYTIGIQLLPF